MKAIVPTSGLILILLCGCSSTTAPSRDAIQFSGFLGDYDQLETGRENLAVYSYLKPGLSLAEYTEIIFDDPEILLSDETRQGISNEDLSAVLAFAENSIGSIEEIVQVTSDPGPRVLRVRWAITDLKPASKANVVTGLVPQARALSTVLGKGTGTYLFVGRIGIEAEVIDSVTGERLMAAVDTRVGANAIDNVGSTWGDVEDAFEFWADRFADNLARLGYSGTKPR
ncbi:MAG: DUF3313 domain-containing protein [Verrucomicrobiae bacterium]|nr:DUF3313 domain-containing protein [Verrucomicrobiae bacterium]